MFKKVTQVALALTAVITMAAPAMAAPIIDFRNGTAGAGGNVTFDGTNAIGVNLPIGLVEIFDAPTNNGVFSVFGTATGMNTAGGFGDLDFNTAANTVSIVGCIPGLGLGTLNENGQCTTSYTLLNGSIVGEEFNVARGTVEFWGPDTKHPALLQAIGLPPNTPFDVFGFSLLTGSLTAAGSPSISTDIRNSAVVVPDQQTVVPEPATMMLLGTGLLAAFKARRRQA